MGMVKLRPVLGADAGILFPLVYRTRVADTLAWDGPASFEEFQQSLAKPEVHTSLGEGHVFTIVEPEFGKPIGMTSIRPDMQLFRGDIGLWLGEMYQGRGYGTQTVRKLVEYGFEHLGLEKIEACVFTGNWTSRRVFEKNGFLLEGTIRSAIRKRGLAVDKWLFGLTLSEFSAWRGVILHLCPRTVWEKAKKEGVYQPASLVLEGFIHCSRLVQILDVANRFYLGEIDLLLLWIDLERLQPEVRWESVDGDEFPHVFGPINLDTISAVTPFIPEGDGRYKQFPRR
jgi:uncharacterized protein (DUF952 family)/predicted acetyltransferase